MIRQLLAISFLSTSLYGLAREPSQNDLERILKNKISANIGFGGTYIDDQQVEARVFGLSAHLHLDQTFTSQLTGRLSAGASLETGSNNSLVLDEYAPERQWILNEGFLAWKPFSFFHLKAGAINQSDYKSPLLVGSSTFLSIIEEFHFKRASNSYFQFYLKAQQSIPNNQNLAQRIGTVQEGTPTFYLETVGVSFQNSSVDWRVEASHFAYNKLSNGVAYRSQFMGNSINPNSQLAAKFLYQFRGYNLSFHSNVDLNSFLGLEFKGQYLYNDKAPDGRNLGFIGSIGTRLGLWTPFFEQFRNESDTSPGYYNSKLYGHNNKKGMRLGVQYHNPQSNLGFTTFYGIHKLLKPNLYQSDTKLFAFSINQDLDF